MLFFFIKIYFFVNIFELFYVPMNYLSIYGAFLTFVAIGTVFSFSFSLNGSKTYIIVDSMLGFMSNSNGRRHVMTDLHNRGSNPWCVHKSPNNGWFGCCIMENRSCNFNWSYTVMSN